MIASLLPPAPGLEILAHEPPPDSPQRPPVLFLHGAYASADCWDTWFLPYFAAHGHPAYALSFRGHGGSAGHEALQLTRISDYLQDLLRTEAALGCNPILVGHSMGALVLQRYLEQHRPPAAVLMAPVPPSGLLPSILRLWLQDPLLMQQLHLAQIGGRRLVTVPALRRALYRADTPLESLRAMSSHFQPESAAALMDMTWSGLPGMAVAAPCPMLVLGGGADNLIDLQGLEASAAAYGLEAEIFPAMPHAMMLDPDWRRPAERILAWLADLPKPGPAGRATRGARPR